MGMKRSEAEWEQWAFKYENKGTNSLQGYVLKRLAKVQDYITVVKIHQANSNGVSDLLLCVGGKFVAIELKVGDNIPTRHQELFLEAVTKTGGVAGIARTWGEVKQIISKAGVVIGET